MGFMEENGRVVTDGCGCGVMHFGVCGSLGCRVWMRKTGQESSNGGFHVLDFGSWELNLFSLRYGAFYLSHLRDCRGKSIFAVFIDL